jgi:hypothetical protein
MPTVVRVCGLDFRVKLWDNKAADNTGAYGLCDKGTLTILIQEDLNVQQEARVLLHEVLHACHMCGGLREAPADDEEERIVDIFTYQLVTVVRDNPQFIKYLQDAFK